LIHYSPAKQQQLQDLCIKILGFLLPCSIAIPSSMNLKAASTRYNAYDSLLLARGEMQPHARYLIVSRYLQEEDRREHVCSER
jgi:hypothetical protein